VAGLIEDEDVRAERLLHAQARAVELFAIVEQRGIIAPGVCEIQASDEIRDLAAGMFGVDRQWHKRIVRAGPNTLKPYRQNPPDRVIAEDDPAKHALCDSLPVVWDAGRAFFESHSDITGEELFVHVREMAAVAGWEFGGEIAGHLVGQFHNGAAGD
jgi:hypothetical protein